MTGGWKTLKSSEWTWILGPADSPAPGTNCRTSSTINSVENTRYAEVKVNGVRGLLIFPDTFTWPEGISTSKQPTTFNTYESNWNSVNYTAAEFILLESAGCVFLPAAGDGDGSFLNNAGGGGNYWSSVQESGSNAYSLFFSPGGGGSDVSNDSKYYGYSVSPVRSSL